MWDALEPRRVQKINGRRQRSAQGRMQDLVSKIVCAVVAERPIAQSCIAARLPENQERRRGFDEA